VAVPPVVTGTPSKRERRCRCAHGPFRPDWSGRTARRSAFPPPPPGSACAEITARARRAITSAGDVGEAPPCEVPATARASRTRGPRARRRPPLRSQAAQAEPLAATACLATRRRVEQSEGLPSPTFQALSSAGDSSNSGITGRQQMPKAGRTGRFCDDGWALGSGVRCRTLPLHSPAGGLAAPMTRSRRRAASRRLQQPLRSTAASPPARSADRLEHPGPAVEPQLLPAPPIRALTPDEMMAAVEIDEPKPA
jgi:hypothetical protein